VQTMEFLSCYTTYYMLYGSRYERDYHCCFDVFVSIQPPSSPEWIRAKQTLNLGRAFCLLDRIYARNSRLRRRNAK
jgi:hypothetical protein